MDASEVLHRIDELASAMIAREMMDNPPQIVRNTDIEVAGVSKLMLLARQQGLTVYCHKCDGNPLVGEAFGYVLPDGTLHISRPNFWMTPDHQPGPVTIDYDQAYLDDWRHAVERDLDPTTPAATLEELVREEAKTHLGVWRSRTGLVTAHWAVDKMAALGARAQYKWKCSTCREGKTEFPAERMEALVRHIIDTSPRDVRVSLVKLARLNATVNQ